MRFLEPLRDGDILRASFYALPAIGALVSALFLIEPPGSTVAEPPGPGVIPHHGIIVHLEDTWDFHAAGTGHTVSTISTGDRV